MGGAWCSYGRRKELGGHAGPACSAGLAIKAGMQVGVGQAAKALKPSMMMAWPGLEVVVVVGPRPTASVPVVQQPQMWLCVAATACKQTQSCKGTGHGAPLHGHACSDVNWACSGRKLKSEAVSSSTPCTCPNFKQLA